MNKKVKLLSALSTVIFSTAVLLGVWPCLAVFHQPKIPEGFKKLRKS